MADRLLWLLMATTAVLMTPAIGAAKDRSLSLERCGRLSANESGYRNPSIVSKQLERRISDFAAEAALTPGLSVAVVKDGHVAYLRGFGASELEACTPVDPDTRFYLKSTTKSFLGLLAALMHEEGIVALDAPITEFLPDLDLLEPLNAAQVPLRAHFTHTIPYMDSGLQHRTASYGNLADEDFVAHASAHSVPRSTTFEYSNFGPMMGARALEKAAQSTWRDLIETKIFAPAGMSSSFTHVSEAEEGNAARSYVAEGDGLFTPTATKHESQMVAAGGSYSTVRDLARWLILNLEAGAIEGEQVFSRRTVEQALARQVQLNQKFYEFHRFAHGLGIHHSDYEGDLLVHHFGGETHVSFMPEHRLGVVVLTNAISGGSYVTHRAAATIYDTLLGKSDVDARWRRRAQEIDKSLAMREQALADHMAALEKAAPKGPRKYAPDTLPGVYENDRLGDAEVSFRDGELHTRLGVAASELQWVSGDGYLAYTELWGSPPELWVFRRDEQGDTMVIDWGGRIFARKQ